MSAPSAPRRLHVLLIRSTLADGEEGTGFADPLAIESSELLAHARRQCMERLRVPAARIRVVDGASPQATIDALDATPAECDSLFVFWLGRGGSSGMGLFWMHFPTSDQTSGPTARLTHDMLCGALERFSARAPDTRLVMFIGACESEGMVRRPASSYKSALNRLDFANMLFFCSSDGDERPGPWAWREFLQQTIGRFQPPVDSSGVIDGGGSSGDGGDIGIAECTFRDVCASLREEANRGGEAVEAADVCLVCGPQRSGGCEPEGEDGAAATGQCDQWRLADFFGTGIAPPLPALLQPEAAVARGEGAGLGAGVEVEADSGPRQASAGTAAGSSSSDDTDTDDGGSTGCSEDDLSAMD